MITDGNAYLQSQFDKSIFMTFNSITYYLIAIIIATAIHGAFLIAHDSYLIKNRNALKRGLFFPAETYRQGCLKKYERNIHWNYHFLKFFDVFCCIVIIPVQPLIEVMGQLCYKCKEDKKFWIWWNCQPIAYISTFWVILARVIVIGFSSYFIVKLATGFTFDDDVDFGTKTDDDYATLGEEYEGAKSKCTCECVYFFLWSNFAGYVVAATVLIITNLMALLGYTAEAFYGQYHLYTIQYSLPLGYANNINPDNCTGDVLGPINLNTKTQRI